MVIGFYFLSRNTVEGPELNLVDTQEQWMVTYFSHTILTPLTFLVYEKKGTNT